MKSTIDLKFSDLCDEIDYWKIEAKYWKDEYDNLLKEDIKKSNESLEHAQKGVANALMFALSATDDEKGNLVISKKDRKKLAESFIK